MPTSGFTGEEYRKLEIEADFLGALRGEIKANLWLLSIKNYTLSSIKY